MINFYQVDALSISHAINYSQKRIGICNWFIIVVLHMQLLITAYIFFLPKTVGMFEFLGSKGDRRGEQVLFSDFKYHLQKMLKSKNLLQFNVSKIILRYFTAYTA